MKSKKEIEKIVRIASNFREPFGLLDVYEFLSVKEAKVSKQIVARTLLMNHYLNFYSNGVAHYYRLDMVETCDRLKFFLVAKQGNPMVSYYGKNLELKASYSH